MRQDQSNSAGELTLPTPDQAERISDTLPQEELSWHAEYGQPQGVSEWLHLGLGDDDGIAFQDIATIERSFDANSPISFTDFTGYEPLTPFIRPTSWDIRSNVNNSNPEMDSLSPTSARNDSADGSDGCHFSNDHERAHLNQEVDCIRSAALLHTFYRLSSPGQVPRFSDLDFVGHFFKHVCRLYSCFDSTLNPIRRLVAESWTSSPTIYFAIQSMAVGHLANWYPYMAPLGLTKRSQAWRALQHDLHLHRVGQLYSKTALLSLLLLGLSSTWHHCSNLGLQYLCIARNLIQRQLQSVHNGQFAVSAIDREFYTGALIHWEMLASFIDPVSITPFAGHGSPNLDFPMSAKPALPHPWTGIATELHFAMAEVGRILRRQRSPSVVVGFSQNYDLSTDDGDRQWAANLETFLRKIKIDSEDQIADYEDPATPKIDLIHTARAHQYVGLLEIYRIYPDLLMDRLSNQADDDSFQLILPDGHSAYTRVIDSCLAAIAVQIMELLDTISLSSAACRLHPVLLVAAACQLRFPDSETTTTDRCAPVVQQRYNLEERMLALSRKFPQKPLLRMMDIVKEVWDRLDVGNQDPHWIDVINEKGWQTIMG
jgi:Fungal specific transcription factor domain